jgi:serine/threonine protein kinase
MHVFLFAFRSLLRTNALRRLFAFSVQWVAPEVLADSRLGSPSSDVYMLGGLLFELLTGGQAPFHWLLSNTTMLRQRRRTKTAIRVPGTQTTVPGLGDKSVLEAAAVDGVAVNFRFGVDATSEPSDCMASLQAIMKRCLAIDPSARWSLPSLLVKVGSLRKVELTGVGSEVERASLARLLCTPAMDPGQRGTVPVAPASDPREPHGVDDGFEDSLVSYPWTSFVRVGALGSGAFGTIVKMRSLSGDSVAVKSVGALSVQASSSFSKECRLCGVIARHPHRNVVQVIGRIVDAPDSKLRLILGLYEKGSLNDLLWVYRSQCGLALVDVLGIFLQVACGVLHLHSLGILHRDVRAANVLVASLDPVEVALADLGVSHQLPSYRNGTACLPSELDPASAVVLMGADALGPAQVLCVHDVKVVPRQRTKQPNRPTAVAAPIKLCLPLLTFAVECTRGTGRGPCLWSHRHTSH